jgi:hypothetical protein
MTIRAARLPLALVVDALWSYAAVAVVVAVLGYGEGSAPSLIGVAAVVVGSFALARALQETELGDAQFRGVGAGASAIAIFAIVHLEYAAATPPWDLAWMRALVAHPEDVHADIVVATVALMPVWFRGFVRGQQSLEFDGVLGSAALGLVPVAIAAGAAPPVHGPDAFGPLAIAYLPLALGALALYHAPDPLRPLRSYAAQWGAGAAIVLVVAAALTVIAAAIDPGALGVLAPVGRSLAWVFGNAAKYILGPPLAAIGWLFGFIPLPHGQQQQTPVMPNTPLAKRPEDHNTPLWTRIVGWIIAGGVVTLVGLATLFVLWLLFRRFAKRTEHTGGRRERVEAESSLAGDLGAAFDALTRRFRRGPKPARSPVDVRRLYHEMLERSAAIGLARPPAATPLQFAPRLDAHYASDVPSAISRAFAASRYGAYEFDRRVVDDLRMRWNQVEAQDP